MPVIVAAGPCSLCNSKDIDPQQLARCCLGAKRCRQTGLEPLAFKTMLDLAADGLVCWQAGTGPKLNDQYSVKPS